MCDFLVAVWPRYELALLLNAATDIYEDDFENMIEGDDIAQGSSKGDSIKEAYSFQSLIYSKNAKTGAANMICAIDWHEVGKGTLGCAYVAKDDFKQRVATGGLVPLATVLVWDFADNINPRYVLEGPNDMFCFRFNPTNPEWVVAGCISGQVVLWNLRGSTTKRRKQQHSGRSDRFLAVALRNLAQTPRHRSMLDATRIRIRSRWLHWTER